MVFSRGLNSAKDILELRKERKRENPLYPNNLHAQSYILKHLRIVLEGPF